MIYALLVLLVLGWAPIAHAAAFTSKATGNWNSAGQTTWNEIGTPGDGDSVTISHAVTITATQTVGATTAAFVAITLAAAGSLTINAATTIKGSVTHTLGATVTIAAGVTVTLDCGANAHAWTFTAAAGTGTLDINGTSGSRVTLTKTGAGTYRIINNLINPNEIMVWTWDYVTLDGLGSASLTALQFDFTAAASEITWNNVLIKNSGQFSIPGGNIGAATLNITGLDIRGALADPISWTNSATKTGGTRSLTNFTFFRPAGSTLVGQFYVADLTIDGFVMYNLAFDGAANWARGLVKNGFYINDTTAGDEFVVLGESNSTVQDVAFISNASGATNTHLVSFTGDSGIAPNTVQDCLFSNNGANSAEANALVVTGRLTIQRSIFHDQSEGLVTSATSGELTLLRNTFHNAISSSVHVSENIASATHMIATRNNLFVSSPSGIVQLGGTFTAQTGWSLNYNNYWDMTSAGNLDHPTLGTNSYMGPQTFASWFSAGAYGDAAKGADDKNVNPSFVDSSRTVRSWDTSLGGAGTLANLVAEAVKLNGFDSSGNAAAFDGTHTIAALLAYIRAGYAPTNSALTAAGDPADGSPDIGAVAVAVAATAGGLFWGP